MAQHISVAVVGGGQAGLSASYFLQRKGVDHLVFEKRTPMHVWATRRWDNFCLVTPNWQCQLPGHAYDGADPDGFMKRGEILTYLESFLEKLAAPIREHVTVKQVKPREYGGFDVITSEGDYTADQVIVASGGYDQPIIPRAAERIPATILQVHSELYRNAENLPEGAVLVVGSGQSGAQIAEDLHLEGRKVHLAVGGAPRCARFYRGRDVVKWLADMNYYDMPMEKHPLKEGVRDNTNHYVTGRDGGRDIDLRQFAREGMQLYGALEGFAEGIVHFDDRLEARLDEADRVYNGINAAIDQHIAQNRIAAALRLQAGLEAAVRRHIARSRGRKRDHDHLVHRLPSRFRLARRAGVQRPGTAGASSRRHPRSRPLFPGTAVAAQLGLGPLLRRGARRGLYRRPHRGGDRGRARRRFGG